MTELTRSQKTSLVEDGYVVLRGAVSRSLVNNAMQAINASLGAAGIDPAKLATFRARSYCPELQADPAITGLLNRSTAWTCAEAAIGGGNIAGPVGAGQIALRFPSLEQPRAPHPHLDGMYTPANGVPKGAIRNFTALVGVVLSDVSAPDMGNLWVWPGSHRLYERYFRKHGPRALLEGMPDIALPEPRQIMGAPGDAVLCHYQLGHGIGFNGSPLIRYAVYFRLKHVDHDAYQWECMTDIWREWSGLRDVLSETV